MRTTRTRSRRGGRWRRRAEQAPPPERPAWPWPPPPASEQADGYSVAQGAVSSAGRAPAPQAGGRRFDPVTAQRGRPWKQGLFRSWGLSARMPSGRLQSVCKGARVGPLAAASFALMSNPSGNAGARPRSAGERIRPPARRVLEADHRRAGAGNRGRADVARMGNAARPARGRGDRLRDREPGGDRPSARRRQGRVPGQGSRSARDQGDADARAALVAGDLRRAAERESGLDTELLAPSFQELFEQKKREIEEASSRTPSAFSDAVASSTSERLLARISRSLAPVPTSPSCAGPPRTRSRGAICPSLSQHVLPAPPPKNGPRTSTRTSRGGSAEGSERPSPMGPDPPSDRACDARSMKVAHNDSRELRSHAALRTFNRRVANCSGCRS